MAAPEIDSTEGIKIGDVLIHAGNVDGRDVSADGTALDGAVTDLQGLAFGRKYVIGDGYMHSSSDDRESTSLSYTKIKEISLDILHDSPGTLRIGMKLASNGATAYGKIYKNGVAHGSEHTSTLWSGVAYSDDLSFADGDLIQIYVRTSNASYVAKIMEFWIQGSVVDQTFQGVIDDSKVGIENPIVATNQDP